MNLSTEPVFKIGEDARNICEAFSNLRHEERRKKPLNMVRRHKTRSIHCGRKTFSHIRRELCRLWTLEYRRHPVAWVVSRHTRTNLPLVPRGWTRQTRATAAKEGARSWGSRSSERRVADAGFMIWADGAGDAAVTRQYSREGAGPGGGDQLRAEGMRPKASSRSSLTFCIIPIAFLADTILLSRFLCRTKLRCCSLVTHQFACSVRASRSRLWWNQERSDRV